MRPPFLDKKKRTTKSTKSRSRTTASRKISSKTKTKTKRQPRKRVRANTSSKGSSGFFSALTNFTSLILILLLGTGTLLYIKRDQWGISSLFNNHLTQDTTPIPDPDQYKHLIAQLDNDRAQLRTRYLRARTEIERQEIISEASNVVEDSLPPMMRCWLGHPWDFHGTATIPGEGKIACGYFVTTIMRDAGFKIDRIRVAQQASQNIIRTFVESKEFYEVKTNTPYTKYVDDISKKYEGIHIVGLDKHVAFIVIKNGEMRFIHSGGLLKRVVDEGRNDAYSLEKSNYRVISNISRNRNVIKKWILGEAFVTVK